jgi:2-polyprenyl-3-methyl-5-hydroxy-6-metoxy-1,4-benzoquinol methylase
MNRISKAGQGKGVGKTNVKCGEDRAERERQAYDEKDVGPLNGSWHDLFHHVFECPNTLKHLALLDSLLDSHAIGKRVLEIGCSSGEISRRLIHAGASYVHGIDISENHISEARKGEIRGKIEFSLGDVTERIEGSYDMICGRSILHHIDFRSVLPRLCRDNLNENGVMLFLEPLGTNVLIRLYHLISRSGHTPDEKPFFRKDLAWLKTNFPDTRIMPANLLSFILGVPSSFVSTKPDNRMLRFADAVDSWIAKNVLPLAPYFRLAIMLITKAPRRISAN